MVELVDAQRVASNGQVVLVRENRASFEPGSLRSINLVSRAAVSFLVEAQQVVAEGHPDFIRAPFHANRRQDPFEYGRLSALLLTLNLFASGLSARPRVDSRVLKILSRITIAVVLADRRFRQIAECIVQMVPGVRE